jgi:fatty acid desaturase
MLRRSSSSRSSVRCLLQFFTGNIGLHRVHHLNARIPNYNLQRAHDENQIFDSVPTISLRDGLRAVRLKLWDEDRGRLVSFAEVSGSPAARAVARRLATGAGVASALLAAGDRGDDPQLPPP